ncbi:GNAT family N-acetyltransferase [candidate division GN15 bacterium]|nr:GNAT family N-acetyltransferase [candidate division GN15 bacterium]
MLKERPMISIRQLHDADMADAFRLMGDAYPGIGIVSDRDVENRVELWRSREHDPRLVFYGAYHQDQLVGAMRLHDFSMHLRGTMVATGGVGAVAVHLAHKKQHVAKDMMEFYLDHYHRREFPMAILWPFRTDFYHNMGFGYGARVFQYRLLPAALPKAPGKEHVRYLSDDDCPAVCDCYNRCVRIRNGLIQEHLSAFVNRRKFQKNQRWVGYVDGDMVRGYIQFNFDPSVSKNFIKNDLEVTELFYEDRDVLAELLEFLRVQADQINRITISTAEDEFYFQLADVRDDTDHMIPSVNHQSHVAGVGIMYRILDLPRLLGLLADHDFNGVSITLKITQRDTFFPSNAGSTTVKFEEGRACVVDSGSHDVEITLDVAELSSLLMGSIGFRELHLYRLAEISDPSQIDTIDRLFVTRRPPLTVTPF